MLIHRNSGNGFSQTFLIQRVANKRQVGIATTYIKRQLISGDNSYHFEKATTHIKR